MKRLYCVRDEKAESFGPIMEFPNDAVATRVFGDSVVDPQSNLNKHPEDYAMYQVGEYEDNPHPDSLAQSVPLTGLPIRLVVTAVQCRDARASGPALAREA